MQVQHLLTRGQKSFNFWRVFPCRYFFWFLAVACFKTKLGGTTATATTGYTTSITGASTSTTNTTTVSTATTHSTGLVSG